MDYDGKCPNGCPMCTPDRPSDPFRKALDYVEHGDADSLVAAALDIVYAHADTSDRATMIASAVDKYRGVES
jgi:hypothetical protein